VLSHLDSHERAMLRGEIRRVQKLMGLTALFVTHDQLEALAMSDKIIVLNDGELQQIGTPEEIYDTPTNLFVAGFVGEPAMNTMIAERSRSEGEDFLTIAGQRVSAKAMGLTALPNAESFILGVRPKNVKFESGPGSIQGRIHTFEVLGDFTLASIELNSGDTIFKIGEAGLRLNLDQQLAFAFDPWKVLFYDRKTTLRILAQ